MIDHSKASSNVKILPDGTPCELEASRPVLSQPTTTQPIPNLADVANLIIQDAHRNPREYIRRVDTKQQGE